MKKLIHLSLCLMFVMSLFSCKQKQDNKSKQETASSVENTATQQVARLKPLVADVLTKEEQDALTPDQVIGIFKEGNKRYMINDLTLYDHSSQVRESTYGQYPKAIILSCVDSRVPVEFIFDRGIGDIFVARVAGNFVNEDILGSMEYACKVAGSKLVVVLGHEFCGAIKSTIKGVELGNITPMLAKIKPAMEAVKYDGEKTVENKEYLHLVCESNVKRTIQEIREKSPILKEMEDKGEIKIVGAIYDMHDGQVVFQDKNGNFKDKHFQ